MRDQLSWLVSSAVLADRQGTASGVAPGAVTTALLAIFALKELVSVPQGRGNPKLGKLFPLDFSIVLAHAHGCKNATHVPTTAFILTSRGSDAYFNNAEHV